MADQDSVEVFRNMAALLVLVGQLDVDDVLVVVKVCTQTKHILDPNLDPNGKLVSC